VTRNDSSVTSGHGGKVERLIDEYDLDETAVELKRKRRGEDGDVRSLRDLAAFFNRELVGKRLADVTTTVLDGETDNLYRLLTDDDVSRGERIRARSRLERSGIDVDNLERDFVSREAIRSYFERRGVARPTDDSDQVEKERDNIGQLRSKTKTVTEDKVQHLRETDRISIGDFGVVVNVQVICEDCNTAMTVGELLDERTCACTE
jgi:hypothetical protein